MNASEIRKTLQNRGVKLGKPADLALLRRAERELNLGLHGFFRELYSSFDGFVNYDDRSQISLWSIERILSEKLREENQGDAYFAVGDFLIESDFVMCSLEKESARIFLLYERTELGSSALSFFDRLLAGELDF